MFKLENNLVSFNALMTCIMHVWEDIKMELGHCRKPCKKQIFQLSKEGGHPVELLTSQDALERTSMKCKGNMLAVTEAIISVAEDIHFL